MLYYFVPDASMSGGIKVAYQFVDALNALGVPAVIASPGGMASTWFQSHAAVIDATDARRNFHTEDIAVFSFPQDYSALRELPGQLVFHCRETSPLIGPILADSRVQVLTCWRRATEHVRAHGVLDPIEVGVSIAPCFAYTGEPKFEYAAACMPRQGAELCEAVQRAYGFMRYIAIDGLSESEVARVMKYSSIFLATDEEEWFGLPALEAMSAGCIVVSVPVQGGMEYLEDGINGRVARSGDFVSAVGQLLQEQSDILRFRMRQAAVATARGYTQERMLQRLSEQLHGPLSHWRRNA
jgi:hypothetical protein